MVMRDVKRTNLLGLLNIIYSPPLLQYPRYGSSWIKLKFVSKENSKRAGAHSYHRHLEGPCVSFTAFNQISLALDELPSA